jgi:response regulator RpfG family c-di-GMP phosphodiesterase
MTADLEYKRSGAMPFSIIYYDEQTIRRNRIIRGLRSLAIDIRPAASLPQAGEILASDSTAGVFLVAFTRWDEGRARFLEGLKSTRPDLSIIVLTNGPDEKTALRLLAEEIVAGIAPLDAVPAALSLVRCELRRRTGQAQMEIYSRAVRRLKAERAKAARQADEMAAVSEGTLENLMTALDMRDVETFGHSQTVAKYSQVLAQIMGIRDENHLEEIHKGALLHDIGKIAIPDSILKKPGNLSGDDWEKIRLHPALGHGLIKEIKMVKIVGNIILFHHEHFDGSGYPRGLKKDEIPIEARIFAVADALDAITAHRPYRRARDFKSARREIIRSSGTQFDPAVVDAFVSLEPENWEKIRFETTSRLPGIADFSQLLKKVRKPI